MNLKERAAKLKTDIPAVFPALRRMETPFPAKVLAGVTVKLIPKEVFAECRAEANDLRSNGKPKRWYYAMPIVLIWAPAMFLIITAIWLREPR